MDKLRINNDIKDLLIEAELISIRDDINFENSLSVVENFDSMKLITLITIIEKRYNIVFDENDLDLRNFSSISAIEKLLLKKLKSTFG